MSSKNKAREVAARKLMSKPWAAFERVEHNAQRAATWPDGMTRAYKNNYFVVMVWDDYPTTHGPAIRAFVQRLDGAPIHEWPALQRVKNEIFGRDCWAVEYFPAEAALVDNENIYWMWVFPPGVLPLPSPKPGGPW